MDAKTINQTYDLIPLVEGDTKLKRAGKYYIGACPFCGGTDRFNLKDTPQGWRWLCRHCTEAKYKTPIDYIMRREDLDFKQALAFCGGDVQARPREQVAPVAPSPVEIPDQAWQAQRWQEVTKASTALFEYELPSQLARIYLQERALDASTWQINLLGFAFVFKRPAIVIPWWDVDTYDTITAIKYRFIDDLARDPGKRFMMAKGSKRILFGMNAAQGHDDLIFVEGEFNAMSITQASDYNGLKIDALSFGSETGTNANVLNRVAQDYKRVIVWADDAAIASAIRSSLARPADALCSPVIDGVKYDANALLQKAWLSEFLRETLKHPHPG